MIISGNLLEVGVKNDNGWGIPLEEAQDIISLLPGLPLKICKDRAHACDYKPKTEAGAVIGKILSASRKNDMINITAEVTGEEEKRIRQGKYPKYWSIFAGYKDKNRNGYLAGVKPLSVSLVNYPAYRGAGYSILSDILHGAAAALDNELSELDQYYRNKWQKESVTKNCHKSSNTPEILHDALDKLERKASQPVTLKQALDKLKEKYRGK